MQIVKSQPSENNMTEPSLIRQATASGTEMPLTASGTDLASDGQVL